MRDNLKKMISYYKPYKGVFFADMFFAIMASAIALVIPLVVRYVTSTVIYMDTDKAIECLIMIAIIVTVLILFQCYCNYYISNYGHVMGAKIEYDMRKGALIKNVSFSFGEDRFLFDLRKMCYII